MKSHDYLPFIRNDGVVKALYSSFVFYQPLRFYWEYNRILRLVVSYKLKRRCFENPLMLFNHKAYGARWFGFQGSRAADGEGEDGCCVTKVGIGDDGKIFQFGLCLNDEP